MRAYVIARLKALGLDPQVQTTTAIGTRYPTVENLTSVTSVDADSSWLVAPAVALRERSFTSATLDRRAPSALSGRSPRRPIRASPW